MTMRCCRICDRVAKVEELHKYGVRHYAHFDCWADAALRVGVHPEDLPSNVKKNLSVGFAKSRGILDLVIDEVVK